MKLFRKLDSYLLHHYPGIWVTRLHAFLPLGLGIALVLFLFPVLSGWNFKDDLPHDNTLSVVLMIIPVLIYLVYWFIFQSRYNVAKSGVNVPVSLEYLNFFCYLLVFFTAFLIISAIPLGNYQKIRNAFDEAEFEKDIINLNLGNTLVNGGGEIIFDSTGTITYTPSFYVYETYFVIHYEQPAASGKKYTVTRQEAEQIIANYITSYNHYTHNELTKTPDKILAEREAEFNNADIEEEDYNTADYEYYDYSYRRGSSVKSKIYWITNSLEQSWYFVFAHGWLWKVILGIMAYLSLLIWIFKQMHLRQFVFAFIALCLTPLFAAIIGVILFGILDLRSDEESVISGTVLLFYLVFTAIVIRAYMAETLHKTGYVLTMYLQVFLPVLPIFIWMFFIYENRPYYYSDYNGEDFANFMYWSGWTIGLISIALFKPVYAKFRSLPSKN